MISTLESDYGVVEELKNKIPWSKGLPTGLRHSSRGAVSSLTEHPGRPSLNELMCNRFNIF
jgi:hypothetical protein